MARLRVALHLRNGLHGERVPENSSRRLVDREQTPLLRFIVSFAESTSPYSPTFNSASLGDTAVAT